MSGAEVLLVDDDPSLREVVRYALTRAGYRVQEAKDGREALLAFRRRAPDLIVLDVSMPELDGMEVCREIRKSSEVPILFLSSRSDELDRVLGLELGGDDYVTKPFSPRELVSRVKAVLRRTRPVQRNDSDTVKVGRVTVDRGAHRVWVGEQEIALTVTELRILDVLIRRPGRVFPRSELVDLAYPGPHHVSDRTLDSHVRRIRQKLREAGSERIETVHGLGFRFQKDE